MRGKSSSPDGRHTQGALRCIEVRAPIQNPPCLARESKNRQGSGIWTAMATQRPWAGCFAWQLHIEISYCQWHMCTCHAKLLYFTAHNQRKCVTGLFTGHTWPVEHEFIQIMPGDNENVKQLYEAITQFRLRANGLQFASGHSLMSLMLEAPMSSSLTLV